MSVRPRQIWLTIHRWLGLTAGLLFVLLGLTGSLLVFDHALDEWLNPKLLLTEGSGARRPLREIIAAAEAAYEGSPSRAAAVNSPRVPNGVWTVWFQGGPKEAPKFTQVLVDPFTAGVTGQRVWGKYLMTWIYRLHFQLLAGKTGATLVGLGGILLMISCGSGLYLWWPLWKHSWRAAFAVRRGSRFNYDLHKVAGAVSSSILLVIAFTGVYLVFPEWVKPLVTVFSAETPPPQLKPVSDPDRQPITPEEAIQIAERLFPEASFDHFHPPRPDGVYEVAVRQPGEVQRSFGRTQVFIEPYTGEVLAVRNPQASTFADAFIAWQFPLHNGEAFGLAGRWVVFVTGLTPAILYATGFVMWRRRRSPRNRRHARPRSERPTATVSA